MTVLRHLARVEPEVKEEAENIMSQLGIPSSAVINMLYKQIILTKGIPFSLTLHHAPKALMKKLDTTAVKRPPLYSG